jgi:hypothetical protein
MARNLYVLEIVKIDKCRILHYFQGVHNFYEFGDINFIRNLNFEMFKNQEMICNYELNIEVS